MSVFARDGAPFLKGLFRAGSRDASRDPAPSAAIRPPAPEQHVPRSDVGTILLHWSLAIAIVVSLLTGLRLSADAEHSVFARSLEIILPQGEIWSWHFVSALAVLFCMFAYGLYMSMARLKRRVSLKKTVVLTLPASPKLRWAAVNVMFYWLLFASVLVLAATGVLLYLGHGGLWVEVHYISALIVAGYIVVHVFTHYMYGGLQQLLRLFRPQSLRAYRGMTARPFAKAAAVGAVIAAGAVYADFGSRDTLRISEVAELPQTDGRLDEAAWQNAAPVRVRTQQGANLGGSGESTVEIRAVRTGTHIAFAFRWNDPTRSLKRHPLVKRADGWHMLNNRAHLSDETAFYEDKFSVMFSRSNAFGTADSTHMGPRPLAGEPATKHRRGLHYTTDGSINDVWQWKASRGGMIGAVDDMHFGPPKPANAEQRAGKARYSAGYDADEGKAFYVYNYRADPETGYAGTVGVKRLPVDYRAVNARMGSIDIAPEAAEDAGAQWWMFENETVPYSAEHDAGIPVGTVIPGVLIMGEYAGSRADLRGGAEWNDGHWTLEVVRPLSTGHAQDLDMESGLYMWVAVFDRNQTRHTRHVRPVRLDFE